MTDPPFRSAPFEVRADGEAVGRVTVTAMRYGVLDSYRTRFRPGCFADYLQERAPVMCWAHDISDVIGQTVDVDDSRERLRLNMQLDDFEAVPRARQAYAQLLPNRSTGRPTLRDMSVGFERHEWEPQGDDTVDFVRCGLPEVSVVAAGAVPGAMVDSVRGSSVMVPRSDAIDIAMRLHRGEIDLEGALVELYEERTRRGVHAHARQEGGGTVRHSHSNGTAMHAHPGLMPMMRDGTMSEGMGQEPDETRAQWTTAYVNSLPDSSFAYIEDGGTKDGEGKTVPRSLRHFPYKDAEGKVDLPHLRNALSRLPQSDLSDAAKAEARTVLEAAARKADVGQNAAPDPEITAALAIAERHRR